MTYYSGFLVAVPKANKAAYVKWAEKGWPLMQDYGALAMVETWGVDVPDGKVTSFPMATKLKEDEVVVMSWLEWPDRATADAGMEKMKSDPRMKEFIPENMPYDGMRMMWGGFETIFSARA